MGFQQRAYDDFDSTGQMVLDCAACGEWGESPRRYARPPLGTETPAQALPWTKTKGEIELAEAAAHLAARLHLA